MHHLEDYRKIAGDEAISAIYKEARRLYGRRILHINSTYYGGGVAEILNSLVPLMNNVGIEADWRILHGTPDLFTITKKFHNALQGDSINLTEIKKQLYVGTNEAFSTYCHIDADCVFVHDPQPLPVIKFYKKRQPWVWRCHIDLTNPNKKLWEFLKGFILRYDMVIFSSEKYKKEDLPVEQKVIYPSIDPLSLKNKELSEKDILKYVKKAGIPSDKPVITQVSRMDPWKDPEGLLEVFKYVKEKVDCRMVYCYDVALDDPEGVEIYSKVYRKAKKFVEKGDVIFVVGKHQILVNAIQRFSTVLVQNSIREGFCLAITEALWKGKPVVATNVGGIPLQIKDGENGFLVEPGNREQFADRIIKILEDPSIGYELGKKAREVVRERFLITRTLLDYLRILNLLI
ncbi:MAG: glycosyltransferase [Deltaproteobacteria bacterium]|nr:glycosyltransferase [Deltaproteobacteria bacterium]